MSNIFGTKSSAQAPTKYTQLNIQTSTAGVCIPILLGKNRAGTNIIWFNNFQAHAVKSGKGGKGGGGKGGASSYTYTVSLALALCEGPITAVGAVWVNQGVSSLSALNLSVFYGTPDQAPPAWITSHYPAEALSYAYTAYLFSDNYDLGSSSAVPSHNFEITGPLSGTNVGASGSVDANPADIILELLTNVQYGISLPPASVDPNTLSQFRQYCTAQSLFLSPYLNTQEQCTSILQRWAQLTNTFIFWSGNQLKFVPLASGQVNGNEVVFNPLVAPVYNLTYDDFLFDPKSEDPVTVTRIDPADGYNSVEIDINDRSNAYNTNPVFWRDQVSASVYGVLQSNIISAAEVCDSNVAGIMASLIGQRAVYIRNTYAFKLPTTYSLLEPGDIVTITEPNIGLSNFPVRILTVDEDDKYDLAITAEEFPAGIGIPSLFSPATNTASPPPDIYADPGDVNPPLIMEPSPIVTAGAPQIWVGLSGGSEWGGAEVWISTDAVNYGFIGSVQAPSTQGILTAPLPSHPDPDTVDTLLVDTSTSGQPLSTAVTDADADSFQSVALVDQELIAFGNVAVSGTLEYNLTYLRRGVYGTTIAAHDTSAPFSAINPATLFTYTLSKGYVGETLYFKFLSINRFGNDIQDIASVVEYQYVPIGVAYTIAPPSNLNITPHSRTQADGTSIISLTFTWSASAGPQVGSYNVEWSIDDTNWTGVSVGADTLNYITEPALANTNYFLRVAAISQNGMAQSSWVEVGPINSGSLVPSVPPMPTTLTVTPASASAILAWMASPPPISGYQIWRAPGLGASFYGSVSGGLTGSAGGQSEDGIWADDPIWRAKRGYSPVPAAHLIFTTNALGWTDDTIAPSTAYTYWLIAVNSLGSSAPGPASGVSVTTLP